MNRLENHEPLMATNPEVVPQTPVVSSVQIAPVSKRMRAGTLIILLVLLLSLFSTGVFAGWQLASGANSTTPAAVANSMEAARTAVIAKVRPAVVQIEVLTKNGDALGSGVIIDARGYIVTNNHVIAGAQQMAVMLFDGTHLAARLVGADPADDLAVISITAPTSPRLTVATFGDSSQVQVGQDVLVIGNPLGITQTVTSGIVSAVGRTVNEQGSIIIPDALQTDAAINPGNSGGALVNMQGQVIGIPTLAAIDPEFKMPADGVGFALPSNRVQVVVRQIIGAGA